MRVSHWLRLQRGTECQVCRKWVAQHSIAFYTYDRRMLCSKHGKAYEEKCNLARADLLFRMRRASKEVRPEKNQSKVVSIGKSIVKGQDN